VVEPTAKIADDVVIIEIEEGIVAGVEVVVEAVIVV
jgi:hypothetical protein